MNFLVSANFKYKLVTSFVICFSFILVYDLYMIYNYIPNRFDIIFKFDHGDDYWYWVVAKSFQGVFDDNIAIHKIAHRGYFFTFAIYLIQQLADILHIDKMLFFQIVWAGMFSFSIAILIPKFSELLTQRKTNVLQSLLLLALISFFWRGFFYVPLADFPGLFSFIAGLYALVKYHRSNKLTYLFMAGLFVAMAALCRGPYKYSFYLVVAYLICMHFPVIKGAYKNISIKFSKELLAFFLGMLFISWPEAYLNKTKLGVTSFFPYAQVNWVKEDGTANENNVTAMQLQSGIGNQKVLPGIYFDKHAAALRIKDINSKSCCHYMYPVDNAQISASEHFYQLWKKYPLTSFQEYLAFVLSNPIDFVVIYSKHLFNGLDIKDPRAYLAGKSVGFTFAIINYIIIYLAIAFLYKNRKKFLDSKASIWLLGAILLPSLLAIPTQVETRFFLSIHVLVYFVLCFFVCRDNFTNIVTMLKQHYVAISIFVIACLMLSSANLGHL